ncbi:N-acylglucosamine-6-phosphate 2-epimerase [Micromonospora viridifaciens]|uniref:Putative N-acetylmannosamine-6-phosphate 2-epimerase n=1 Tax=Micromonospora viridifaciens TaxID=1881 RepID=A0A1C4XAC4_MICVI|nr:N-acetylmannosamine-6-phosphate 2-epimerase [Micromonospora viridifaciens]SCF05324.1 N-acylglucosamine-6-phosphate 2-epimerase [Micromonospora viridifaciens]
MNRLIEQFHRRLVVSCQAYPGEPMRSPDTMRRVALAAVRGGAAGIRAQGLEDITAIRNAVDVPLIGLWKDGDDEVFITPTLDHAVAVARAGADIVALDGTSRPRPDGLTLAETIAAVHEQTGALVMADCSTLDEGITAANVGADLVSTTLAGYTAYTTKGDGPDLGLVARLAAAVDVPVVAEGRIHTPAYAAEAVQAGAWAVVVGTAITHPTTITGWFASALVEATAADAET